MKSKKIIALMLGTLLSVGLVTGCKKETKDTPSDTTATTGAQSGETTTAPGAHPVKGAPITFKFFNGFANALQFPVDNDMAKWVEEQTGVKIEIEYMVGDLKTKIGVMTASGDYPDFIFGNDEHQKFIEAGAAIPLNDYIEKFGANIKKTQEPILKKLVADDGNIYFIAPYREGVDLSRAGRGFWVQRKVLKAAGYPKITNLDDYFKLLEDYKAKNPKVNGADTIAFDLISDPRSFWTITNPVADLRGYTNDGMLAFDPKTITGKVYGNTEDAKTYYKKLNEAWNKGLIDSEAFTNNVDQYMAKLASGRVLGFYDQWWQFNNVQVALAGEKRYDEQYVCLPVVFDPSVKERYQTPGVPIVRDGISISTKCKDPERAFKFIDWLMDEDVQKRITWGEKGKEYEVDDKGMFYRTPEQRELVKKEDYRKQRGIGLFGYPWPINSNLSKYSDGNPWVPEGSPTEVAANYSDADRETLAAYGVKAYGEMFNVDHGNPWGEAWDVKLPEGSDIQITSTQIDDLTKNYVPRIIMAKTADFDKLWNEYKAEYEKLDYHAVEDFITKAIQDRVNKWK